MITTKRCRFGSLTIKDSPKHNTAVGFRVFAHFLSLNLSLEIAMTAQTQEELLAAHLEQQKINVSLSIRSSVLIVLFVCSSQCMDNFFFFFLMFCSLTDLTVWIFGFR